MPSDDTIRNITDRMAKRMSDVETLVLRKIGARIKQVKELLPSDATAIAKLRDVGGDVAEINSYLMRQTELNAAELQDLYREAAEENLFFAKRFYDVQNIPFIPYADNRPLQRIVEAQARITGGTFENLSQTTVVNAGGLDRRDIFLPIRRAYIKVVDDSIQAVSTGLNDYNKATHSIVAAMARSGLQTVEYATGRKRRLDSAVRQNIVDGVRAVNFGVDKQIGEEIGANGYELSAHMTCAPDHLPMQGRQFSQLEFDKLQSEQESRDYQGHVYAAIKRPFMLWNCRHFARSCLLGVDKPVWSDEALEKLKEDNETKIDINGAQYTPYEASQLMRRVETYIRKAKNETVAFEAAGDTNSATAARAKVTSLTSAYEQIAKQANMRMKYARIRVPGYR